MSRAAGVVFLEVVAIACVAVCASAVAATPQAAVADYARAARLLPNNLQHHMYIPEVKPHWVQRSGRFWYLKRGPSGKHFMLVDSATGRKGLAFNHERLAKAMAKVSGHSYKPEQLPFRTFRYGRNGDAINFKTSRSRWIWWCRLKTYHCQRKASKRKPGANSRSLGRKSPDGKWVAFVRKHNLYVRSTTSKKTIQLTEDGRARNDYARPLAGFKILLESGVRFGANANLSAAVSWSPDSSKLITYRLDSTHTQRTTTTRFVPGKRFRPMVYKHARPMPGKKMSHAYPIIFDIGSKQTELKVDTDPLVVQYLNGPRFKWSADGKHVYYLYQSRGDKYVDLREIDVSTGKQRVVHHESAAPHPYIEPRLTEYKFVDHGSKFLWTSERSGWNQIYLYDTGSGEVLNQVTNGDWVVQKIVHVDENARQVYFVANGVDPNVNPYFAQLYRIGFDGTGMMLLTPENANHAIDMAPDGKYFVDDYSRPDEPGAAVLRRLPDGDVVKVLEGGSTKWLEAQGWSAPVVFKGAAADGTTALQGVIFRPPNFDPGKKYPVVENIYPGPHRFRQPVTFRQGLREQRMAALGFVVVVIDGRGTAGRSRAFRDLSYRNIAGMLVDHVAMIKQMAVKYPWMDVDRVGVFGTSEGGYATAQAMLMFPEFYKVGVATSGNYITLATKAVYSERYQGYPVEKNYQAQSSDALADNLQGHLLLVHGDLDSNVDPAQMLRFAGALMAANKPFDMLLVPEMQHGDSGPHRWYVTQRRWDYFYRHLSGRIPPRDFKLPNDG